MTTPTSTSPDTYDGPWKEAIETYFPDCMAFFFPKAASQIDWSKPYEFLDKELQQIAPEGETGQQTVDKLIKVQRTNGEEQWVLIHLEVQSQYDSNFAKRMFTYYYRLLDRYQKQIASMAILGDERPNWRPKKYKSKLWGCKMTFKFDTVKLLRYKNKWAELEASNNPFAILVMAHLYTQETQKDPTKRFELKWRLMRMLYEKGYNKRDIQLLFKFIDWLMKLPEDLKQQLKTRLINYEEEHKMPYITSIEELALAEGREEGREEGKLITSQEKIIQALKIRFNTPSQQTFEELLTMVKQIDKETTLDSLFEKALTVDSIIAFKAKLESYLEDKSTEDTEDTPPADSGL